MMSPKSKPGVRKGPKHNQLLAVASMALRCARPCLASYACPKSRQDFTQPQLLACLVLKAYLRQTYRGLCEVLELSPPLCEALGMDKVPHWTTLQKFAAKEGVAEVIGSLIGQVLAQAGHLGQEAEVAVDSTGMQIGQASMHYRARSGRRGGRYVKLSVAVVCGALLPAALVADLGPTPDLTQMPPVLEQTGGHVRVRSLYADRGYDAEWVHRRVREDLGGQSWIPPVIRTGDGSIKTPYRALMATLPECYGRRWHAESFFGGLKRSTLSTLASRRPRTLLTEASIKVLAYAMRR
jgi:hypothetical protein